MDANTLPITGPCPVDFDRSTFDDGATRRFCDVCSKNVHNLSAMSRDEARTFLRVNAGKKLCVTYKHDARGDIRFRSDGPPATVSSVVPVSALTRKTRPEGPPTQAGRTLPLLSVSRTAEAMAPTRAGSTVTALRRPAVAAGFAAALAACTPHGEAQLPPTPDQEVVEPDEVVEGKMEVVEPDDDLPVLAGAVAIPEPVDPPEPVPQVEGEIEVPMPMGDIVVPELDPETPPHPEPDPDPLLGDTPCDGAQRPGDAMPSLPYEPAKPPPPHAVRGRVALPDDANAG